MESGINNSESVNPSNLTETELEQVKGFENSVERHSKIPQRLRQEVLGALSNTQELFLGSGNYGVVLNNASYKNISVCIKIVWEKLEIFEGEHYSDEGDAYIKGLKKFRNYFDEIKLEREKMMKDRKNEFVPQNTPAEEFEKMLQAYELLKESGIDCYIPDPYLSGFDEIDDTFLLEDEEEEKEYGVYSTNNFHILVMKRIKGKNLQEIVDSPEENKQFLDLFIKNQNVFCGELKRAISFLNDNKIKHGDLHMRNIMIDEQGKPVIIDFGVNTHLNDRDDLKDVESTLNSFKKKINIDK